MQCTPHVFKVHNIYDGIKHILYNIIIIILIIDSSEFLCTCGLQPVSRTSDVCEMDVRLTKMVSMREKKWSSYGNRCEAVSVFLNNKTVFQYAIPCIRLQLFHTLADRLPFLFSPIIYYYTLLLLYIIFIA